jgi:hypothetical protein
MAGWLSPMLIVAVAGRKTTRELDVFQLMEVRSILGFLMLYPLVCRSGEFAATKTSRPLQHIGRNLVHYAAQLGWFFALTLIPLGQLVSIEFTIADLDRDPCQRLPRRTPYRLEDPGHRPWSRRRRRDRPSRNRPDQSRSTDRALRSRRLRHLQRDDEIPDAHRAHGGDYLLDACGAIRRRHSSGNLSLAMAVDLGLVLDRGDRVLRDVFAFLHGARDALCRCHHRAPMDFLRVPLTATAGWLLYTERLDIYTVLGALLILTGNLLNLKTSDPAPARAAT